MKIFGFPPVKKNSFPWKNLGNNPWKINSSREISTKSHPWKPRKWAWKKIPLTQPIFRRFSGVNSQHATREKKNLPVKINQIMPVKKSDYPWKFSKKWAWKSKFHPWKKPKKGPKRAFTGTFDFHGKKKNAAARCRLGSFWFSTRPTAVGGTDYTPHHALKSHQCLPLA